MPSLAPVATILSVGLLAAAGGVAVQLVPAPEAADPAPVAPSPAETDVPLHPVTIRRPLGPPRVDSGEVDADGRPVTLSCSSCHTVREPVLDVRSGAALDEFHVDLELVHGSGAIGCYACHDPAGSDALRLADGRTLPYAEVMTLCTQCHGAQARAYEHGAHGGMQGHWDLRRGPRTRLGCTDCHDPHAPAFPRMQPTFKPIDRFLSPDAADHAGSTPHG